jgi:hypothetical protein
VPFSAGRVAVADVNGDGIPDLIIANGPGDANLPRVSVIDGNVITSGGVVDLQHNLIGQFSAFDPSFRGGLWVAAGNLGGPNGQASIVVGTDVSFSSRPASLLFTGAANAPQPATIRVFDFDPNASTHFDLSLSQQVYDASFQGGVRVAVGDVLPSNPNASSSGIIAIAPGFGGPEPVRVFKYAFGQRSLGSPVAEFFPYGRSFTGGVYLATGDYLGHGDVNDILTGPGTTPVSGPFAGLVQLRVWSAAALYNSTLVDITAFQPDTTNVQSNIALLATGQPITITSRTLPVSGVSSVAFGPVNMQSSTRDLIVGSSIGKNAVRAVITTQRPANGPLVQIGKRIKTMFSRSRGPNGVNVGSRG